MPRISVRGVTSSLIAALVFCPVCRTVVADDSAPTTFQRAISSWMGVVALLADDGDGERKDGDEGRRERDRGEPGERDERGERGGREGRGSREWSGRGERPGGRSPSMRMPPMGPPMHPMPGMHAMHGMPMPGMRPDASAKLTEIVDRLARIEQKLDAASRTGNPWSPRSAAGHGPHRSGRPEISEEARREMEKRREEWRKKMEERRSQAGAASGERPRPPVAAVPPEVQERMRDMMQEGRRRMAEAHEKMELARKKFEEMEERIKKLEAEVERLKAAN